jgi:hypothetical protein
MIGLIVSFFIVSCVVGSGFDYKKSVKTFGSNKKNTIFVTIINH